MTPYATLADVKANINTNRATSDNTLISIIRQVSQRIDRMFYKRRAPFFAPYIETRNNYRVVGSRVNSELGTFYFGEPLLSLSGVVVGVTTLTVGSQVNLFQSEYSPYDTLQLTNRCCNTWYQYTNCFGCQGQPYVTITGTWGYNVDYANAWLNTLQTVTNVGGINGSVTSFTVTDVDAADANGLTPAISAGNLLQIDSEWLEVTATNITTNTVTVKRGVNGSTAAAHNQGTAIYTYQVEEGIRRATFRQVGLQYAKLGAYPDSNVDGGTTVNFSADVLQEFSALLSIYTNS